MHQPMISVVIPAYNEEETIGGVISRIGATMDSFGMPYEILVVDDGSTDKTRQIASACKAIVLHNGRNRGKGYALRKGFQSSQGDIIVTIDSDGSHDPKEIPNLVSPLLKGADMVSGSRFLGNGKNPTSNINRFGNFLFNFLVIVLTGRYVTDSQTGFRAFKKKVLETVDLDSRGYEVETEILVKSLRNGFVFQEKPITSSARRHNASKLRILSDGARIFKTAFEAKFVT